METRPAVDVFWPSPGAGQEKLTKFRFVHLEANGSQAVHRPEARKMNVDELIDNRFVKGLDDSGFVKALYGGK